MRARLPSLTDCRKGVAAVEFAMVLPIFVLILLGAFEYGRALSIYRKVTLTTRAVADLTTQYVQMTNNDDANVLNASSQIMAPYDATKLQIILSQVATNTLGVSTVTWSIARNATALNPGQIVTVPAGSAQPGSSLIMSQVNYVYTPLFGSGVVGPMNLADRITMSPRLSQTVAQTGS